jgi:hypothetical protein
MLTVADHALVWWRRWESKTSDFEPNRATTDNHGKPDPELQETKDSKKRFREPTLPTGNIEHESTQGRAGSSLDSNGSLTVSRRTIRADTSAKDERTVKAGHYNDPPAVRSVVEGSSPKTQFARRRSCSARGVRVREPLNAGVCFGVTRTG